MRVEMIAPLLEKAGVGKVGTDIFQYFMPDKVTEAVLLITSPLGNAIDYNTLNWFKDDRFQVIVRSAGAKTALEKALKIMVALTYIDGEVLLPKIDDGLPALLIKQMRPISDPIPLPRQPSGLWEISLNMLASYAVQVP